MILSGNWKNNRARKRACLFFLLPLLLTLFLGVGLELTEKSGSQQLTPQIAPLNPDFLKYIQLKRENRLPLAITKEGYWLGEIPVPVELEHNRGQIIFPPREAYPASYDLRATNKLTSIKNQGSCGSCWAFATYGSLESFLLPGEYWDFSEQHLIDTHGFDWGPCDGGNHFISSAYLTRWSGPVWEQDNPYIHSLASDMNGFPVRKHAQEVIFLPSRANFLDNDNIKAAVMTYGAVYISMYWDSSFYNSTYKTFYCNLSGSEINHAVAIVGWDDNFDKNKFNTPPAGNGAFIVRNSWGESWGEGGYFYLSYYDTRMKPGAVFTAEAATNYSSIYQYDHLGWVSSFGYGSTTAWGANIFTATSSNPIVAIGIYTASVNSYYELYIYRGVTAGSPRSGTLVLNQGGTIASPGYHTIILSNPVPLSSGELFSVAIKLTTPGFSYPIPAEIPISGYSSQAVANSGESFISSDGNSWFDLSASGYKANICLKAFTSPISSPYMISGCVRDAMGNGINNVILNGLPSTPQTDNSGYYIDWVPLGWSGTVTPWRSLYNFMPSSRSYTGVNRILTEQNYLVTTGGCNYSISPTWQSFPSSGGSGSINVSAGTGCSWAATSKASWITITSGSSGSGSGVVNYQVATNSGTGRRSGQIIVAGQTFTVFQESSPSSFSPNNYQIIPEAIWAPATGGGTWVTEAQIIDFTGGSQISAYFYYGGGASRGPMIIWTNSGGAGRSIKFDNLLYRLQMSDAGLDYYGKVGAVAFRSQDSQHRFTVTARTVNGNYGKTLPGINPVNSELISVGHDMILTNLAQTDAYRSFAGFFNISIYPVTVEFQLYDNYGNILGSPFTETFVGNDYKSFNIFKKAGLSGGSYENCWLKIHPVSGSGMLIGFGSSSNNFSNDPAAHLAISADSGHVNSPGNCQIIPEVIWAAASGGGTWVTEVQIIDLTGGSQVNAYFRYGDGASRGSFVCWTNSGGAGRSILFTNLLSRLDSLDPDPSFSYYGRVGAVEFQTQDSAHKILVTARTVNGNYGKTFPGINLVDCHLAEVGRDLILTHIINPSTYRFFVGGYNPTANPITVEFTLFDTNGNMLGNSFVQTFSGYDFRSFNIFARTQVSSGNENCWLLVHPVSGSGKLLLFGSSSNNSSNDTAAHILVHR